MSAGRDPDTGRYRQVRETFRGTKKQAEKRLSILVAEVERGERTGSALSVDELLRRYLAHLDVEPETLRAYESIAHRFIGPAIGTTHVDRLRPEQVQKLYASLAGTLEPWGVRKVHTVLSGALSQAVRWGWVHKNVASVVPPRWPQKKRSDIPTDHEVKLLKKACADDPDFSVLLELELVTGARPAELCALRWDRVDLDTGTITIDAAVGGDRKRVKQTKTGDVRRLPVSGRIVKMMRAYRKRSTGVYVFERLGFVDGHATMLPWRPDYIGKRFRVIREAAGVTCQFYALRHYVASKLAETQGPETVAYFLGHKRISTSMDIYTHVRPARMRDAASVLG